MKISKRQNSNLTNSAMLWLLPSLLYFFGKLNGVHYHNEYVWWVSIPILFVIWLIINFKIIK
jgi:hypothetical protein